MTFLFECVVSASFFGGSIYMMTVDDDIKDQLYNQMSEETQVHYNKIKKERMEIYIKATVAAIFSAFIFHIYFKKNGDCLNKTCISTAIYFFVQYIVYMLHPKSDWVLNHIENKEQAKLWVKKYNYMKNKWHIGLVLGIIGYFLGSYFISSKMGSEELSFFNANPYPEGPPLDIIQQAGPVSPINLQR